MNAYLLGSTSKISDISNPAHKILFGDGYSHTNNDGTGISMYAGHMNYKGRIGGIADYIHDGKKNVVHVDGHVEASTKSYLSADSDLWERN